MSKKKIYNKHLEKGRFYIHSDGHRGHPAFLYKKRDKKNLYLALTTDTSKGEHRTKLKVPTEKTIKHSYVNNRPLLAKRKNIGGLRENLRFSKRDKKLLRSISENHFRTTSDINRRDKRYMKRLKKKPRY